MHFKENVALNSSHSGEIRVSPHLRISSQKPSGVPHTDDYPRAVKDTARQLHSEVP